MSKSQLEERIPMIPPHRVISRVQILAETKDYNHEMMNVPAMWKQTKGGGVKVVVLDTGVPSHPDLSPQGGKSFIDGYEEDGNGHGTHVGGIIAAIANNGMGVAGIAPDCEDYYGAVLGADGGGTIQAIIGGIRWAVDEVGANIINMSLGISAGYPNIKELEDACNYAVSQGVAVICAAGNEAGGVGQPACFDSTIAVAAVNSRQEHAWFSNTGPEVTLAAGGVDVYSTYLNKGYAKLSGTSMASPALAGIATLIQADEKNDNGEFLSPEALVEKMLKIAYDVGDEGFDEVYGHGIPIFSSTGEPDEPEQPEQPDEPDEPDMPDDGDGPSEPDDPTNDEPDDDDNNSPCKLGLPMAKVLVDGTVAGLSENRSLEESLSHGILQLQKFLRRLEANQKR